MKNWMVVFWLAFFFPIGLYLMWEKTTWKKELKYGLSGFFTLVLIGLFAGSGMFLLFSWGGIGTLLFALLRFTKSTKKEKIAYGGLFALLITLTIVTIDTSASTPSKTQEAKQEVVKQEAASESKKAEKTAAEIAKENYDKAVEAVELAEKTPTSANYQAAKTLVDALTQEKTDLTKRLVTVKAAIDTKNAREAAEKAVVLAEENPTRSNYDTAIALIDKIDGGDDALSERMHAVEHIVVAAEEAAKLAAEKAEAESIAKAEQAKAASESAEAAAIAAVQAAEQAEIEAAAAAQVVEAPPISETVYITKTGKKYHSQTNCTGLNNSNSTTASTLDYAVSVGLTPCLVCW